MTQTQTEPKKQVEKHGDGLYYLLVNDEHEARIARAWVDKHHPGSRSKRVTMIPIERLTQDHVVRVLARTGRKITPAVRVFKDQHGIKTLETLESDDPTLLAEVVEGPPIQVIDFWIDAVEETGEEGYLDRANFLQAVGKTSAPFAIKYRSDDKRLSLGFT